MRRDENAPKIGRHCLLPSLSVDPNFRVAAVGVFAARIASISGGGLESGQERPVGLVCQDRVLAATRTQGSACGAFGADNQSPVGRAHDDERRYARKLILLAVGSIPTRRQPARHGQVRRSRAADPLRLRRP